LSRASSCSLFRDLAVAAATAILLCSRPSNALTVKIQPGSSECFVLTLTKGASFSGNYEILTDDFDLDSVDVKVTGPAPHHTEHYQSSGLEEGSFAADAADAGDQLLCLTNADVDMEATLGFAFRADADLAGGGAGGALVATEENVKSMIAVANELTQGLDMLADHQEFMRVREESHRTIVGSTNDKVVWWSVAEAAVLFAMAIWQVLYIRTFFETKRSI